MICIPVREQSMVKVLAQIKKAAVKADLVEVWIDDILDPDLGKLIKSTNKPLLLKVIEKTESVKNVCGKVAFIDIDIGTNPKIIKELKHPKTKLIISFHDYKKTPSAKILEEKVSKAFRMGADIVKISTFARTQQDNAKVLSLLTKYEKKPIIATCMGKEGRLSRILGLIMGSFVSYAALTDETKTAEGQLTIKEINEIIKWHSK